MKIIRASLYGINMKDYIILCVIGFVAMGLRGFNLDTYQVIIIRQHPSGVALEVRINMAGGSMEFKRNPPNVPFNNVKDVLEFLDEHGYSLEDVTVLKELRSMSAKQGGDNPEEEVCQIVQYIFRLRTDKTYPVFNI